jgi:colicin import membrane protein
LIGQLEFEGYSTAVATFAVDHVAVNWNEQAYLVALAYLDYSHFSRSGLIGQLKFEGFTTEQATYGVTKAGL